MATASRLLPGADIGKRQAQRGARAVVAQPHGIVEALRCRGEAPGLQIGHGPATTAAMAFCGAAGTARFGQRDRLVDRPGLHGAWRSRSGRCSARAMWRAAGATGEQRSPRQWRRQRHSGCLRSGDGCEVMGYPPFCENVSAACHPRRQIGDVGQVCEQAIERFGDQLLRAAVAERAGQPQLEVASASSRSVKAARRPSAQRRAARAGCGSARPAQRLRCWRTTALGLLAAGRRPQRRGWIERRLRRCARSCVRARRAHVVPAEIVVAASSASFVELHQRLHCGRIAGRAPPLRASRSGVSEAKGLGSVMPPRSPSGTGDAAAEAAAGRVGTPGIGATLLGAANTVRRKFFSSRSEM